MKPSKLRSTNPAGLLAAVALAAAVTGCATHQSPLVNQADLDAWKDVPVAALDAHSLFITVPMIRTVTESGVEIRNYSNKVASSTCARNVTGTTQIAGTAQRPIAYGQFNQMQNCIAGMRGCDNIFYIKDGKVLEYKAVGQCYTNEKVRPQPGWERLR